MRIAVGPYMRVLSWLNMFSEFAFFFLFFPCEQIVFGRLHIVCAVVDRVQHLVDHLYRRGSCLEVSSNECGAFDILFITAHDGRYSSILAYSENPNKQMLVNCILQKEYGWNSILKKPVANTQAFAPSSHACFLRFFVPCPSNLYVDISSGWWSLSGTTSFLLWCWPWSATCST